MTSHLKDDGYFFLASATEPRFFETCSMQDHKFFKVVKGADLGSHSQVIHHTFRFFVSNLQDMSYFYQLCFFWGGYDMG